jgi:acyl carrier protein
MHELKTTIASALGVPADQVTDDSSSRTVPNWDSIGHMNVVLALEDRFKVSFTVEEIMAMRDVATIRAIFEGKFAQKLSAPPISA